VAVAVGTRNPPLQSGEARAMPGEHGFSAPVAAQRKLALVEHRQRKCFLRKAGTRAAQLDRLGLRLRVRLVPAQRYDRSAGGQIDAPVAAVEIARVRAAQTVRCLGEKPQLLPPASAPPHKPPPARIDSR